MASFPKRDMGFKTATLSKQSDGDGNKTVFMTQQQQDRLSPSVKIATENPASAELSHKAGVVVLT